MWSASICVWIITIIFGFSHITSAAWLRCYKGSIENYIATPLSKPQPIVSSCVDLTLPTVIYTFGYRGKTAGPATSAVLNAYINKRKRNVLLLDWEEEARSGYLGIPLGYVLYAVPNAVKIGRELGAALMALHESGLDISQLQLVGHSLGAHVMAHAGRAARQKGYTVPRITGLDPARALFEGTLTVQAGLDRTCAKFVDIVHSDPGGYGTSLPAGTVDFWPNYSGPGGVQPGCPAGDYDMFSPEDLCSHDRSWRFFVEAITSPTAFPAVHAKDYEAWVKGPPAASPAVIYLGDLTSTRAQGNFFLTTNATAPFSKNQQGLTPDVSQVRRKRRNSSITRLLKYLR
ncbi:pancreatic triacylglycerol lipase [Plutella xylostella]|uniref:pancreatic triacylglycerol lipase n=1 Tax=Plutella xylostella TaxID=51655 RepID=UPI002032D340|nr:pancreatic triacylglycerol lipase [Plutella xylostella]